MTTNAQMHGCTFEGWQCFHCGEVFTTVGGARDHFGATPDAMPGCVIKVSLGAERGLLMKLREVEGILAETIFSHLDEDTELHREIRRIQSRHSDALRLAEELGYARGLKEAEKGLANLRAQLAAENVRADEAVGSGDALNHNRPSIP